MNGPNATDRAAPAPGPAPDRPGGAEWALRERVKELTCLYAVARLTGGAGDPDEALRGIAAALPPAWQYPVVARARVVLDGRAWSAGAEGEPVAAQSAGVLVDGQVRGLVEVAYLAERPAADEGPFLREERALVDEVARQVGLLAGRRANADEQERLRRHLWRSERLGSVGQLAAGLAHELNEPLGSILGYAQLAQKSFGLPDQTGRDLDKVVRAALHARDIIRRLLVFARQAPTQDESVALNDVVRDALVLLDSRCRRGGVRVGLTLDAALPEVTGDRSLLSQAFLNLALNAVQAMPAGGTLTVTTRACSDGVEFEVGDTGPGMDDEVARRCFDPFYTTKDVGEGTGMGLAVTHGIVTSHGGRLTLDTAPARGARFTVALPARGTGGVHGTSQG